MTEGKSDMASRKNGEGIQRTASRLEWEGEETRCSTVVWGRVCCSVQFLKEKKLRRPAG